VSDLHCMANQQKWYVYQLRAATEDLPFYIGKGKGRRKDQHFLVGKLRDGSHKSNKILKCQAEGIEVYAEILFEYDDETSAFAKEKELIKFYGRRDLGTGCLTNWADGGEGAAGTTRSAEWKAKISAMNKGKTITPETRAKISAAKKGLPLSPATRAAALAYNTGRKHSQEHKDKISQSNKGRIVTEETRAKISKAHRGRSHSHEFRKSMFKTDFSTVVSLVREWKSSNLPATRFSNSRGICPTKFHKWKNNPVVLSALETENNHK
jgi:hypothetical protein